jgi:hypothetical protein
MNSLPLLAGVEDRDLLHAEEVPSVPHGPSLEVPR